MLTPLRIVIRPAVIPFGVVRRARLRPICHMCGFLGRGAPVFEIRDAAGDGADLLVRDRALGAALARSLGDAAAVLMRGHGVTVVGETLRQTVFRAVYTELGACLLNPGEMGFEPLKPVGEPDAANSRIRFDVRVEALRPSFVAPFPRWRSSAGCECGKGRGPPLGELQDIVGEADEAPLVGDLLDAAQEKLTEAARLLDLSEHRLGQLLS